nr:hypothetical protein [Wohlfahrtiimonas chitiniclastica]
MKDKLSAMIREAIAVNERSFPWERAIGAGIAMTLPIFIGLWLNLLPYGLMAGLGALLISMRFVCHMRTSLSACCLSGQRLSSLHC